MRFGSTAHPGFKSGDASAGQGGATRDVSSVMRLSHQRIVQILNEPSM